MYPWKIEKLSLLYTIYRLLDKTADEFQMQIIERSLISNPYI